MIKCSTCSDEIEDIEDGWPGESGGTICQNCWEQECSDSWWNNAAPVWSCQTEEE